MEVRENVPIGEFLEIIEGLLSFTEIREKQVQYFIKEIEALHKQLEPYLAKDGRAGEKGGKQGERPQDVLIVDSNPVMRTNLSSIFESEGIKVCEKFDDGYLAIEYCKSHSPGIIIISTVLNGISGLEAMRRIRELKPDTCIIMISDPTDKLAVLKAMQSGASDYITKPINSIRLISTVKYLFDTNTIQ
ncbi:MAG TPA: response regulator [bacterium]|jgi:PleD family two-component response regulator